MAEDEVVGAFSAVAEEDEARSGTRRAAKCHAGVGLRGSLALPPRIPAGILPLASST
jgi:hypothetical protein